MSKIHNTAVIDPQAKIDESVFIGPYTVISGKVIVKKNTRVGSFCVIEGNTTIGENCELFTGAVVGSIPQDKKFKRDEDVFLTIGNGNIFREYVTVNPGTGKGGTTTIGNDNLFMAYSHVAHDCTIGNNCVMANSGTLAGHVTMEDRAVIGGLTAIHQFVRLGRLSIVGGCSKVVQDIPPFSTCDGHPARVFGLNSVGLKRAGVSPETTATIKKAFKILFHSGLAKKTAIERLQKENCEEINYLVSFVKNSKRGLCS